MNQPNNEGTSNPTNPEEKAAVEPQSTNPENTTEPKRTPEQEDAYHGGVRKTEKKFEAILGDINTKIDALQTNAPASTPTSTQPTTPTPSNDLANQVASLTQRLDAQDTHEKYMQARRSEVDKYVLENADTDKYKAKVLEMAATEGKDKLNTQELFTLAKVQVDAETAKPITNSPSGTTTATHTDATDYSGMSQDELLKLPKEHGKKLKNRF